MSLSLPAEPARARSLTDVWPNMIAALDGSHESWFGPARSGIVMLVDGLGARNLAARAGHARFLAPRLVKSAVGRSVFPTTTATALTSLMTARPAGEHGMVGYRVRVPGTDVMANQLSGWEHDGLDPRTWQRCETVFERASTEGRPCFVVSRPEYAGTGFTRAIFGGAQLLAADDLDERVSLALDAAARYPGALIYLYAPDLDRIGHRRGWESDEWAASLEQTDAAAAALHAGAAKAGVGAVLTADHGMVDIPRHRHILLSDGDDVLAGVRHIGGEPRMLHLYLEEDADHAAALARWRDSESGRAWVMSRDDAIGAGLFGAVDADVVPRIGDLLVAARAGVAYYDDRLADKGPQRMVGQHGSLSDQERAVPLIPLGAFAVD
jgi:predicted AlkP superfamily pyrophosphatase or phosphodiesterase